MIMARQGARISTYESLRRRIIYGQDRSCYYAGAASSVFNINKAKLSFAPWIDVLMLCASNRQRQSQLLGNLKRPCQMGGGREFRHLAPQWLYGVLHRKLQHGCLLPFAQHG
jgi:hypothetical protein